MDDELRKDVKLSWAQSGSLYLDEGFCYHCGMFVQFRSPSHSQLTIESTTDEKDDEHRQMFERFLVGVCTRPSCGRVTVVRQLAFADYSRGDVVDTGLVEQEIVYPRRTTARATLPAEVPEALRKTFAEAAAIEYISPNACGFLAGRLLEQSLRHRLLKDANGAQDKKHELRKTGLAGLIRMFVDAGHAPGDLQQVLELLKGFRNFAAHPPQPEDAEDLDIDGPQASFLLNAAAELLDHVYVRPAHLAAMQLQLEQKKRGDAVKHAPEFQLSDTPRTTGPEAPPKSLQEIPNEDVPF